MKALVVKNLSIFDRTLFFPFLFSNHHSATLFPITLTL